MTGKNVRVGCITAFPAASVLTFAAAPVHSDKATLCRSPALWMRRVQVLAKERAMFSHLIESAMHSTPQGFVGVGLIFVYFVIMMCAIVYRIRKGDHMQH